jgi:GNAT superfamily N-acetyltransferase
VIIREAGPSDVGAVVDMAARFISETSYRDVLPFDAGGIERLFAHLLEHGLMVLADREGAVVGMLIIAYTTLATGGDHVVAEEVAWWVEPEHRGGRTAYKMLRFGLERARQDGCNSVTMRSPSGSPVGEFYERLGFRPIETTYSKRL